MLLVLLSTLSFPYSLVSFLSISPLISFTRCHCLIPSFCVSLLQEKSSTTWLHMEEWRKKRPGLNLDRYPVFSPLQCSGFTPLLSAVLCPASVTAVYRRMKNVQTCLSPITYLSLTVSHTLKSLNVVLKGSFRTSRDPKYQSQIKTFS